MKTEKEDERLSKFWNVVTDMEKVLSDANLMDYTRSSSDIPTQYSYKLAISDIPNENQLQQIKNASRGLNYEIIDKNGLWLKIIG